MDREENEVERARSGALKLLLTDWGMLLEEK